MNEREFLFDWKKMDPEAKLGLPAGKFTGINTVWAFFLGAVLTFLFYAALYPLWQLKSIQMVNMFFPGGPEERSWIPIFTVLLSMWCLAFLLLKRKKISIQRQILSLQILPDSANFILSPDNSVKIQTNINEQVYHAEGFIALNRIQKTLINLKNIGRVSDVSSVLNDLAVADEKYLQGTYTLPKGLIWAIPVTGFIGTVLGLSEAIGGFGSVVSGGAGLDSLKQSLSGVTGGLSVAFETTLIALAFSLFLQLFMTMVMQKEEALLDECAEYCYQNIISKLKMLDIRD